MPGLTSYFRRAGAQLLRILAMPGDPGNGTGEVQVYGKTSGGVTDLYAQDSAGTVYQLTPPLAGGSTLYGPMDDGNVTDPASPLTRSVFYDTLTLSNGYSLDTGGYQLSARVISVPTGSAIIHHNGGNGGSVANDSAAAGTPGAAGGANLYGGGGAGGSGGGNAGGNSNPAPRGFTTGAAAAIPGPSAGNNGNPGNNGGVGQGGSGGAGGSAAAGTGGTSGASGSTTVLAATTGDIRAFGTAVRGAAQLSVTRFTTGTGGGAGGIGNTAGGPGGGGGGGGYVCITAGQIIGNLTVQAKGGNGGNGSTGTAGNNCGGGGGGGGGGGIIVLAINSGSFPTTDVSGGTGGTGGTGAGTGNDGGNGGNGGAGLVFSYKGS